MTAAAINVIALTTLYPNSAQPHRAPFNRHQLRLLASRTPVRVIAPVGFRSPKPSLRSTTLDEITVDHPTFYYPPGFALGWHGHAYFHSVRRMFQRAVREFRPDVVFAPWAYPDGWAAVRLASRHRLPVVIQVHGSDIKLLADYPAKQAATVSALMAATSIVAVSGDLARDVAALGVPSERITVNYDGIDPELFHPGDRAKAKAIIGESEAKPIVLFVGNLVPVKAVHRLVDAVAGLPVRTIIVGAGPLRDRLELLAKSLAVDIRFTGSIALEALKSYYQAANVFVLPSESEGVPNVLLEASACGTPWVASDVGGIPEIAHLGRSTLVPRGDVESLRSAIVAAISLPAVTTIPPQRLRTDAVADLHNILIDAASHKLA
jgi:glycosyltransferase involved in cell wall biosynthesis